MVVAILCRRPGWTIRSRDFSFLGACTWGGNFFGVYLGAPASPFSCCWARRCRWVFCLSENSPHRVLPVSELGRNVEEIGDCLWSPLSKLMDQGLVGGALGEGAHYISVGGIREFVSFFVRIFGYSPRDFLWTPLEVPRASGALVGALEVPDKCSSEVGPICNCVVPCCNNLELECQV